MNLNSQQQYAVELPNGPILIIAGPGTGKTRTLVSRILHLITEKNVNPESICALTFTTKAAEEIKNRLHHIVDKASTVNTFHGLAYSYISDEFEGVQIATDIQRSSLVRELKISTSSARDALLLLSQHKRLQALKKDILNQWATRIDRYNKALQQLELIDYDDILIKFYAKLLQDLDDTKMQFSHVLIDEFQDTNALQYECLKLLRPVDNNFFVIGDPLQSIYAFQGAHPDIFNEFRTDFPQHSEVFFETNYRSTAEIVRASSSLFPKMALPKSLPKSDVDQNTVHVIQTIDEFSEAQYVAQMIDELIGGSDLIKASETSSKRKHDSHEKFVRFSDIAVLYRTHHIGRQIEAALEKSSIPFQRVGGNSLFERPDIENIINEMENIYTEEPDSKIKLSEFLAQYENSGEDEDRIESKYIKELRSLLMNFDRFEKPLESFFAYIRHIEETHYYDDRADRVTLSTLHASKGLEFPYVFIIGCDEGIIPFFKKKHSSNNPAINIDEEKRLLYVGMTRAGQQLHILTTQFRHKNIQKPSRFLKQLEASKFYLTKDPAMQQIIQQRRRRQEKKSQLKLF